MTNIGSLLDEETRAKLAQVAASTAVVADLDASEPARPRTSEEVDIDPKSEAMIDAACYFCQAHISIVPTVPEGIEGAVRLFCCEPCGKAKASEAVAAQRNVEVIRRPGIAKHQPRTTDGVIHPVTTTTKEKPMMDLDNMTDAELGALVRSQMKATIAEQVVAARPEVEAERKQRAEAAVADVKVEQAEQPTRMYAGFRLKTDKGEKIIPVLDVTNVSTLQEMPASEFRSPYNKALSALGEPILDAEVATWGDLIEVHQRLAEHDQRLVMDAGDEVTKAKKKKPKKAKKVKAVKDEAAPITVVVAVNEAGEALDRKAKALSKLLGVAEDEARERILAKQ